ncbi:uncharacterized protein [Antedon mediterranea]|uniref:uncharacterized protein n=1 Tax=Antedon mediterranea TaxID=105859 RepID=UPI003AF61124
MRDRHRKIKNGDFFGKRRIIVLGETGVGKTSLINNLTDYLDDCDTVPTDSIGITHCYLTSDSSRLSLPSCLHLDISPELESESGRISPTISQKVESEIEQSLPTISPEPEIGKCIQHTISPESESEISRRTSTISHKVQSEILHSRAHSTSTYPDVESEVEKGKPTISMSQVKSDIEKSTDTCIPPPTVSSYQTTYLEDAQDTCISVFLATVYLLIVELPYYGLGALFLSVLCTFQIIKLILTGKLSFQSVPRVFDVTLFLTLITLLIGLMRLDISDATELNRKFALRCLMFLACITATKFKCRIGIILALNFFQFPEGCIHHATSELISWDVKYKHVIFIFIIYLSIGLLMLLDCFTLLTRNNCTVVAGILLAVLVLVSYLIYPSTSFVFIVTSITIHLIPCCYGTNLHTVVGPKLQCIAIITCVILTCVFGLESVSPNSTSSVYIEVILNCGLIVVLWRCSSIQKMIEHKQVENTSSFFKEGYKTTVAPLTISIQSVISAKTSEINVDYFSLKLLEFAGTVQFENLYHEFITHADVYIYVFKLKRNIAPETQGNILLKRLHALKSKGILKSSFLLLVGTHKSDVTQTYIDSLLKQIDMEEWRKLCCRNNDEQMLYTVDNDKKDNKQFDDIVHGVWERLISQERARDIPMEYVNLQGKTIHLKEKHDGKIHIPQTLYEQSSTDISTSSSEIDDTDNLLEVIVRLFTDRIDKVEWIKEGKLRDICNSTSNNLVNVLQELDLVSFKDRPTDKLCLVPSLLPTCQSCSIRRQTNEDAVFYVDFPMFHGAVFYLIVLYILEKYNNIQVHHVCKTTADLRIANELELLLGMIQVTETHSVICISIRTLSNSHHYMNMLHNILTLVNTTCEQKFRNLKYSFGLKCPEAKSQDPSKAGFHILTLASRDTKLPDDLNATISVDCCNKTHVWSANDNKVATALNARILVFKDWPQEVVNVVCKELDKSTFRSWKELAGVLHFTVDMVETIEQKDNKTSQVLQSWNMMSPTPPTLEDLINALRKDPLERRDIIREIEQCLKQVE